MSSPPIKDRRFRMVCVPDRFGEPVPVDEAAKIAMRLLGVGDGTAALVESQRSVRTQTMDVVIAHPSFDPVPVGVAMPMTVAP